MFVVGILGVGADVVSVELNMPCTPNAFHLSENHRHIKAPLIAHHSIIPTVIVVAADLKHITQPQQQCIPMHRKAPVCSIGAFLYYILSIIPLVYYTLIIPLFTRGAQVCRWGPQLGLHAGDTTEGGRSGPILACQADV